MPLRGLPYFERFDLDEFLRDKRLFYVKTVPWLEQGQEAGSKVTVQILQDDTVYQKPEINNFGEQLTIKVPGLAPSSFETLKPLKTEIMVTDVERAFLFGDYRNQLSIIASVSVKGA